MNTDIYTKFRTDEHKEPIFDEYKEPIFLDINLKPSDSVCKRNAIKYGAFVT